MALARAKKVISEEMENIRKSERKITKALEDMWNEERAWESDAEYFSSGEEEYIVLDSIQNQEEYMVEVEKLREELKVIENLKEQLNSKVDINRFKAQEAEMANFDRVLVQFNTRLQHIEQYSRLNSALLHLKDFTDVPNDRSEGSMVTYACRKINENMNLPFEVNAGHIDTAHLLQRKNRKNKAPILIIKFVNRWLKNEVMNNQQGFRDQGVAITEHLCEQRMEIFKEAQNCLGRFNVFTNQGVIYFKTKSGERKIRSFEDIQHFAKSTRRY